MLPAKLSYVSPSIDVSFFSLLSSVSSGSIHLFVFGLNTIFADLLSIFVSIDVTSISFLGLSTPFDIFLPLSLGVKLRLVFKTILVFTLLPPSSSLLSTL